MIDKTQLVEVNIQRTADNRFRSNYFEMREEDYQHLLDIAAKYVELESVQTRPAQKESK